MAESADLDSTRICRCFGGMESSLRPPAEAGRIDFRLERAGGEAGLGIERVIARGGDVVGSVGMEDRRQVLDLAAADAELVLAAAVGAHAALLAEVVGGEQRLDRAEARRLEVDGAG